MNAPCPVCCSHELELLLERTDVPVMQNALYRSREEARSASRGQLKMRACFECGFVWNAAFDPGLITYSTSYENAQTHSEGFRAHLEERLARIAAAAPAAGGAVLVEVGCGQGDFLGQVADRVRSVSVAYGFDPAWRGRDGEGPRGARIFRRYFDTDAAKTLDASPDIVISRHTIEHVPDPVSFLKSIRSALGNHPAKLFLETPCNHWIQTHDAAQDFFYEHCSIFGTASLARALKTSGFVPTRIERVFGEQYLWAEADADLGESSAFAIRSREFATSWIETLRNASREGDVAVWGAGAKGATFLLLTDPEGDLVRCVIDLNPRKQGGFLPGTGHRIVSPEDAAARRIRTVVVMNPNYECEIVEQMTTLKWAPSLLGMETIADIPGTAPPH